jgi:predicted RNase H-related nuclease YkuK (DUF458 family)
MKEEHEKEMIRLKEAIVNSSPTTRIYVGCDSKRAQKGQVKFATVVVLHIDGNHGGRLFSFIDDDMEYQSATKPKMRLLMETHKAVDICEQIKDIIEDRPLELHLDLNTSPKHKSHDAVKESLGYVFGMLGFEAKLKPDAWCASTAADRLAG